MMILIIKRQGEEVDLMKSTNRTKEIRILKTILWLYIILAILLAGLNYGYANQSDSSIAEFITWFWHFYENWIKTLFIIIGSFLTLRIIGTSQHSTMRKRNLGGFILAALVVHIVAPLLLHNKEIYLFAMPLPWTTTPLQLLYPESPIYLSRYPIWGVAGISAALIFYFCISVIIIVGTLLFGRRWQCSTLCLFNGFASEVFAPAFPLIGNKKKVKKGTGKVFTFFRWFFLSLALFFTLWWILFLSGVQFFGNFQLISKLETFKYLSAELLMMMFFWIAFIGRGYCYYCPLGTVLSLLSKLAGQKIITNQGKCIQCNRCNLACPMSIDIKSKAELGQPVTDLRCVGCGHCIDSCPEKTLRYSTSFLDWFYNKFKSV
ncbi:MAG TPA: 4Fe-4S dicluster domain-containing protein [Atribacterota bacterium]|nr:4Fe-4S dicluster domain-containing protein [Atribacterota bacterium]